MQSQSIFSNTLVCRGLAAEQRTLCGDLEKILEVITLKRKMHRKLNLAGDGIKILKKKAKSLLPKNRCSIPPCGHENLWDAAAIIGLSDCLYVMKK